MVQRDILRNSSSCIVKFHTNGIEKYCLACRQEHVKELPKAKIHEDDLHAPWLGRVIGDEIEPRDLNSVLKPHDDECD